MTPRDVTIVATVTGLYDERARAVVRDINDRRRHFGRHIFENASLSWGGPRVDRGAGLFGHKFSVDIGPSGAGGIRYCVTCKHIDCIHLYDTVEYEVQATAFTGARYVIGTCRRCARRVLVCGAGYSRPSNAAFALMTRVTTRMGVPAIGVNSGYGSRWVCELPATLSQLIETEGEPTAEAFLESCLRRGEC